MVAQYGKQPHEGSVFAAAIPTAILVEAYSAYHGPSISG